jgi:hypothetical protein
LNLNPRSFSFTIFLGLLLLNSGCGNPLPKLENMDLQEWRADKDGCLNNRAVMEVSLDSQKDKLLALTEKQIISLLGKPDQNELYSRNQKFYTYFLTPAPSCSSFQNSSKTLIIRFNAMGLAKEVSIN